MCGTRTASNLFTLFPVVLCCFTDIEENERDCIQHNRTVIKENHGYFSSAALGRVRPQRCPFRMEARQGQQIRFTLYDFIAKDSFLRDLQVNVERTCPVVAVFAEGRESTERSLCEQTARESTVYESASNKVELELVVVDADSIPSFFLHFQGEPDSE